MSEAAFWVVWNPNHGVPRVRHATKEDAVTEAKRLARLNSGQDFFVMITTDRVKVHEAVEVVYLSIPVEVVSPGIPVEVVSLSIHDDDLPF